MRYAYHVFLVVAESELEQARALALSELGPVDGSGWFSVKLVDSEDAVYFASASALTEGNVGTVEHYQEGGNPLSTLRYFVIDAASGILGFTNVAEGADLVGSSFVFDDVLSLLELTRVESVAPEPSE